MAFMKRMGRQLICLIMLLLCFAPTVGCVGLFANFLNVMGAGLMPAAFDGLEGKRVAVVCVSNSEVFGPTTNASDISNSVTRLLKAKVKKIELVPTQRIDEWVDENGWEMIDFVSLGRAVDAEHVVAVDIDTFSLHEGGTMYKGRANLHVVVYDTHDGTEVYSHSPPEIEFPMNAGVPAVSTSKAEFRKMFLAHVANRIARNFYAFDINEDVAADVKTLSRI